MRRVILVIASVSIVVTACASPPIDYYSYEAQPVVGAPPVAVAIPNPALVPVNNPDFLWEALVDVVDDYFSIDREERVRLEAGVLVEGRIDTRPQGGATYLEPWRLDSVGPYNRLESTLQSIRRIAQIRVIPTTGGYLVDVAVFKELENVPRPEHATTGSAVFRNDSSLDRRRDPLDRDIGPQRWIPEGRDVELEQEILAVLFERLGAPVAY